MKKRFLGGGILAAAMAVCVQAQDTSRVDRALRYVQEGASAPVADPEAHARFSARIPGLAVGGSAATLTLPGGAVRNFTAAGEDLVFSADFASSAEALAAFPNGTYTLSVTLFGVTLPGTVEMADGPYPAVPRITSPSALQSIDVEQDHDLPVTPFADADADDLMWFSIYNTAGVEVFHEDWADPSGVVPTIPSGVLTAGQTYRGEIRYTRFNPSNAENALLLAASTYTTVTRFPITAGGGGPIVDTTPPVLAQEYPLSGTVMTNRFSALVLRFSEPMDHLRTPLVLSATRNGQAFPIPAGSVATFWDEQGFVLGVTYLTGGSWPADLVVSWSLPGGPDGFRDVAGNPLVPANGTFLTTTAGSVGTCDQATPSEEAAFGLLKLLNHLQTGASVVTEDPTNAAGFLSFSTIAGSGERSALVSSNPTRLRFYAGPFLGREFLYQGFASRAALDAEFPDGDYQFQLRDRTAPTTVVTSVTVPLDATTVPPVPTFTMYAAAGNVDINADFTLAWQAFAGATTNNSDLRIAITDGDGVEVFHLPDACNGKPLPVTATQAVVPRGLLAAGRDYVVTLEFHRFGTLGRTIPGRVGSGVAGAGRTTKMRLHTAGGSPTGPVRIVSIQRAAGGGFDLQVQADVGFPVHIEASTSPAGPWNLRFPTETLVVSPQTLSVPASGESAVFYRAVSGN